MIRVSRVCVRDVTRTRRTSQEIRIYRIFQSPPITQWFVMALEEAQETLITRDRDVIRLKSQRQKSLQLQRKHQRPYPHQQQQADVTHWPWNFPTSAWSKDHQQVQATRTAGQDKWILVCNAFQRQQSLWVLLRLQQHHQQHWPSRVDVTQPRNVAVLEWHAESLDWHVKRRHTMSLVRRHGLRGEVLDQDSRLHILQRVDRAVTAVEVRRDKLDVTA